VLCFFSISAEILSNPGEEPFFKLVMAFVMSSIVIDSNLFKYVLFGINELFKFDILMGGVSVFLRS
jgi:hypothetical protein